MTRMRNQIFSGSEFQITGHWYRLEIKDVQKHSSGRHVEPEQ